MCSPTCFSITYLYFMLMWRCQKTHFCLAPFRDVVIYPAFGKHILELCYKKHQAHSVVDKGVGFMSFVKTSSVPGEYLRHCTQFWKQIASEPITNHATPTLTLRPNMSRSKYFMWRLLDRTVTGECSDECAQSHYSLHYRRQFSVKDIDTLLKFCKYTRNIATS